MIGAEFTIFLPKKEKPESIMMTETVNEQKWCLCFRKRNRLLSVSSPLFKKAGPTPAM
ncbi:hypothetical protein G15_1976 [Enterococcus avium]|nr:hypothetical protein G15_1976 [Enterococcus avium]